jgi:alkylated DNA repair dioxygenase AlkB
MLISDLAPPSVTWEYVVTDESRRSYAAYLPCPFEKSQCDDFFDEIRHGTDWFQPTGKWGPAPRQTAWMVKKGCECQYQYGDTNVDPQEYPPWMISLLKQVMPLCGITSEEDWPDSCNMNLYEDGNMSVGWHADDERLFQGKFRDIMILSLSLGQKRKFQMRLNFPEDDEPKEQTIFLGDGDLMSMEGMFQKHYQHRVPKEDGLEPRPRINLTWRWVLMHTTKCPAARDRK